MKLVKYSEDSKIKLIKEVKTLVEGMNLVQVGACMCVWVGGCGVVIVWTPEREEASLLRTLIDGQHRQKRTERHTTQIDTPTDRTDTPTDRTD